MVESLLFYNKKGSKERFTPGLGRDKVSAFNIPLAPSR